MHVLFVALLVAVPVEILVIPNLLPYDDPVVVIDDVLLLATAPFARVKLEKVVQLSLVILGNSLTTALFRNWNCFQYYVDGGHTIRTS